MRAVPVPTIDQVGRDPALFAPQFRDRQSFAPWFSFNRALFGHPLNKSDLAFFQACTGRKDAPTARAKEAVLVVGRRGGKSRNLALIAAYMACFVDWRPFLAPGELGVVVLIAADRKQARVLKNYINAFIAGTALTADLIENETAEEIHLSNRIVIEIVTCSYRTVRGRTIVVACCDEACFWSAEDGSNPASAVLQALRPAMSTIPGALLLIASSPYAKSGPVWELYNKYFGKEGAPVLVWQADTRAMNPAVPQQFIDEAYEADPVAAASEFGAKFRNDIHGLIDRAIVEGLVIRGRHELPACADISYCAFVDVSGGSGADSFAFAIGHGRDNGVVVDAVREIRPPFSPDDAVRECAMLCKTYRISEIIGDRYAGEWPRERFREHGVFYVAAELNRSDLYLQMLPVLNAGRIELLDNPRMVGQLCALERRTARSGKDSIDHPAAGHDDLANVVAGLVNAIAGDGVQANLAVWRKLVEPGGPARFNNAVQNAVLRRMR